MNKRQDYKSCRLADLAKMHPAFSSLSAEFIMPAPVLMKGQLSSGTAAIKGMFHLRQAACSPHTAI